MEEVVIVSGARTPIGRFGGSLKDVQAAELGAIAVRIALERAKVDPASVDHLVFGCAGQVADDVYLSRRVTLGAGLPINVPSFGLNRVCGSGLEAVNTAARWIQCGEAEIVVAGGTESMSQMPYYLRKARWGYRLGNEVVEDGAVSLVFWPGGIDRYHMGMTAENVAAKYSISRQSLDEYSLESHCRAVAAQQAGKFKEEIAPVSIAQPKGEPRIVDADEHPRPDTTLEKLAKLPPAFKEGGCITAGNSSGMNDGAAAVVVMSRRKAEELGIKPLVVLRARASAGLDPAYMGVGPTPAVRQLLTKTGLSVADIDLVELNEAFAAPTIAVGQELGLDWSKVNVNGGAIALGHPVGATGCVLVVKLLHEMKRRGSRYGLVTLCIGGGQGIATVFENLD